MWVLTSIFARKCLFCLDRADIRECVQKRAVTTPAANTVKHKSAQFYIVAHHLINDSK